MSQFDPLNHVDMIRRTTQMPAVRDTQYTPNPQNTQNAQNSQNSQTSQPPQNTPNTPNPQPSWDPYSATRQYARYGEGDVPEYAAPPPARKKRSVLGTVALLLACAVFAFGGSYAANQLSGGGRPSIVYQAAEQDVRPASATGGQSVSDIAAKAGESVVSITTENLVTDQFLNSQVVSGAGSGVILTADGYIITNNHVVDGASSLVVTLPDGTEVPGEVVGTDPQSDIAVVKVDVSGLVPAVVGNMDDVRVGDYCLAIGNPMGRLGGTVTDGIVSALNRELTISGTKMNLLQMSAAVSPGNSGGGLFNANGELIGVVNAKAGSDNTEGLGFAIPVNTAVQVAGQIIEQGYVSGRPALGVGVRQVAVQGSMGLTAVQIEEIAPGGAAEQAGLQVGDILASLDGKSISTLDELTAALNGHKAGDKVEVEVVRGSEPITLTVTLQELVPETVPVGA